MKKKLFLALIPLLLAVAAVWVITSMPQKQPAKPISRALAGTVLKVYTWDTYVAPKIFKEFEKETGVKVVSTIFNTDDDMLAELEAGKSYDVVTPSGNYLWHLVDKKLLLPLPEGLHDIGDTLADAVKNPPYDPKYRWSMPIFYGTTALGVNTQKIHENIISWKQLFERPAGEKPDVGMLDEVAAVVTVASLALHSSDCDATPETLARIKALLDAQKPFVKSYSAEDYANRLADGVTPLQMAWSGDVYIAHKKNKDVKYIYPEEGVDLWMDVMAIPSSAKNAAAAEQFIQFVHDPKRMAEYATVSGNIPAVAGAMEFLPKEMRDAPEFNIPHGVKAVLSQSCPPEQSEAYAKLVEPFLK